MKKRFHKGSITIYMTLVLSLLLALFFTVIEGARSRAVSMKAECAFDLSVYSVFAEYNRELLEQYDLFFIDTSYGEAKASSERMERHFQFYMEENLTGSSFTGTFLEQARIGELSYATDEKGEVFERQAVAYMKQKYGLSYVERLKRELENAEEKEFFTKDISRERESNQSIIDKAREEGIETGEVDENGNSIKKELDLDNPADQVNGNRAKGILLLVMDSEQQLSELSENRTDLTRTVSYRNPDTKGVGIADRDKITLGERLLFNAYITEKCGNYLNPKKTGQLQYQVEYILGGKNNDIDNLKWVVNRLLFLREVSNVAYLFSDGAKVAEAAALATSICTAAGAPVLIEPVKISLLFAWAYAEAVYDVRLLLAGKTVPLIKTAESWHFSLQGMLNMAGESVERAGGLVEMSDKKGQSLSGQVGDMDYEEYLKLLLAVSSKNEKVIRMMDIAEMDVRKESGHFGFCMENCVDYAKLEACVGSKYGYFKELFRIYYYV